jgi:hypothetical protein
MWLDVDRREFRLEVFEDLIDGIDGVGAIDRRTAAEANRSQPVQQLQEDPARGHVHVSLLGRQSGVDFTQMVWMKVLNG